MKFQTKSITQLIKIYPKCYDCIYVIKMNNRKSTQYYCSKFIKSNFEENHYIHEIESKYESALYVRTNENKCDLHGEYFLKR